MITCPYCGSQNTQGADVCDDCSHSLTDLSFYEPQTAVEEGLLKDRIEVLSPRTPYTVAPETPISEVLNQMIAQRIGCVMVVDGEQLVGIFSEYDAVRRINIDAAAHAERPIRAVMTPGPITLECQDKIAFALHKMHVGGYRHLPILTDGKLTGVISIRDILNYLAARVGVPA